MNNRFTRFIRNTLLLLVVATQARATTSTVSANFNGTPISAGRKIWYTSVVNITGTATYPLTIYFTGQTISSPAFTRTVPNAILVIDPSVTTATTVFNGSAWVTTAPPGLPSYYFMSGYADSLTSALPGGLSPVSWTGTFTASRPGVSFVWHMAAAVYTSFNSNMNNLGVKTSNCSSCTVYPNSDGAGTPENYKAYVIGGARGGGGSNYTGGYSGADNVSPDAIGYYSTNLCIGNTATITPLSVSGSWSSSNTGVATVNSSGVVTGVSAGTAKISYAISGSTVPQIVNVTVNAAPAMTASATPAALCTGATLGLHAVTSGGSSSGSGGSGSGGGSSCGDGGGGSGSGGGSGCGGGGGSSGSSCGDGGGSGSGSYTFSWSGPGGFTSSSQNPNRTGMTTSMAGVYTVTCTSGSGCAATATTAVTVSSAPAAGTITGSSTVCTGSAIAMTNSNPGGTWSSSNTSVATVGSTGLVTGVSTGTATISYRITNSCGTAYVTRPITVGLAPIAGTISGGSTVCTGSTLALSNSVTGGAWTSDNTGVATVNSAGLVAGITPGTATISYTKTATCGVASATRVVSVNMSASAGTITGGSSVCAGSTMTLASAATGGAWSSGTPGVATVNSTGMVTGVAAGTAVISYLVTTACGTAVASRAVTVNALPNAGAITGGSSVCTGTTAILSSSVGGGIWSSGATSIATVSASGVVTGVGAGTTNISYTVTNGCGSSSAVAAMAVNVSPNAGTITGGTSVCPGSSMTLINATTGGIWSSGNTAVATVNSTGAVTGVTFGSATISYVVTNGCGTATATRIVSVNATPNAGAISGATNICTGAIVTFSNSVSGGSWSSGNTAVAGVNSAGVVSGVATGSATISYTVTNGCGSASSTSVVMVGSSPNAGTITGSTTLCAGSSTALSNLVSGGVWSSSNTAIATVGATGVVTGVAPGNATVSYGVTGSCGSATATRLVTVSSLPNAGSITGGTSVCAGASITLGNAVSGGTWSSANPAVASVNAAGVVTGVGAGTASISYTVTDGCGTASVSSVITVGSAASAGAITGGSTVCAGSTMALANAIGGGVWSSGAPGVAAVSATGVVTGVTAGIATISYTVAGGCGAASATKTVSVNPMPNAGAIIGGATVCAGSSVTLGSSVGGGVWSSAVSGIASVSSTGVVSGITPGTATISYTVTNGCGTAHTTNAVTVMTSPNAGSITGGTTVCQGSSLAVANAVGGGVWTSGAAGVATVSAGGVVTGVAAGTAMISYTVSGSCGSANAMAMISVNPLPNAGSIIGSTTVCAGSTTTLGNAFTGGIWSSGSSAIATVGSTGVVTGVNAGTTTISYVVANSCGTATATTALVVNALPNAGTISGGTSVCAGATLALTNTATGGVWSSSNGGVATVSSTGLLTAVAAGMTTVSYAVTNGCGTASAARTITVNPAADAGAITGSSLVCTGSSITLGACASGGTWSSSVPGVAMVNSAGVVTPLSAGTTTISYTVTNSCGTATATKIISVNAIPAGLSGPSSVGVGNNILLTTTGGSWTSSNPSVATVDAIGNITGVNAGTATISYSVSNSCYSYMTTKVVTVNAAVVPSISGALSICAGSTTDLSNATPGGSWSSDNTAIATINAAGVVSGVAAGTATISYSLPGGMATEVVTVNAVPSTIAGGGSICTGSSATLTSSPAGGVWNSGTPSVATVDPTTGVVTGVNSGSSIVVYTLPAGCSSSTIVNVTSVNPITGASLVCSGDIAMLANATTGGTWSSSNASIASVNSFGFVNGVSAGTADITYAASGCYATQMVSVFATPAAVSGPAALCAGASASYTSATAGGAWSTGSSNITIDASGNVTGVAPGTATIVYSNTAGCNATKIISVNATPVAISGPSSLCIGGTVSLSDATTGAASWSSGNTAVATIASTGVVTGMSAGTAVVTYALSSGCIATTTLTVMSGLPAISGNAPVCAGSNLSLSHSTPGGTWSSSNVAIATVGSTGVVSGVNGGTAGITYTTGGGCSANLVVTVNSLMSISGNMSTCVGNVTQLTDGTPGGAWTSSNASIATVGSTGIVTGISNGTAIITYTTLSNGCSRMATVNISTMTPITGSGTVCVGLSTSLSNATTGGAWASSSTAIATIGSATGVANGMAVGTAMITYTAGTCKTTTTLSVVASPAAITGSTGVCVGSSITLNDVTPGGTWSTSSSNIVISGTATTSLTLTGITTGPASVSYTAATGGCYRVFNLTVNPLPAAIAGTFTVCPGGTTQLTDPTLGGSWLSSDATKASVAGAGVVTGQATGTALISYRLPTGCVSTAIMTVISSPSAIIGPLNVCTGSTVTLSDTSGAGTWSSGATTIATAGSGTGIVTGISAGTVNISFTLAATGCRTKSVVTVTPIPNAGVLSGSTSVAVGSTVTLTSSGSSGGTWSSSDATIATVGSSGAVTAVVSGASAGSVFITYAVSNACGYSGAYKPVTVAASRSAQSSGAVVAGDYAGATAEAQSGADAIVDNAVMVSARRQASEPISAGTTMVSPLPIDVRVIPNPNGGSFAIRGTSGSANDELVDVEVANMLGQVIYKSKLMTQRGVINEQVQLGNNLTNGTYMLTIKSRLSSRTFHFVMRH